VKVIFIIALAASLTGCGTIRHQTACTFTAAQYRQGCYPPADNARLRAMQGRKPIPGDPPIGPAIRRAQRQSPKRRLPLRYVSRASTGTKCGMSFTRR
jgi:hypothetical protein